MTQFDTVAEMQRLVAFVNTRDVEGGAEEIPTAAALEAWLRDHGLLLDGEGVTEADLDAGHALREALRTALLAHGEHSGGAGEVLATIPLQLVIHADGTTSVRAAGAGTAPALARLVAAIPAAVADGSWWRTKACSKDACRWAYYDRSRNRSRRWCSMDVCGNREKTRTFRERHRDD